MIRLENILKISLQEVLETSWRCLEDVFARGLVDFFKMSWRRPGNVLGAYSQDEYIGLGQGVLRASSEGVWLRRMYSSWSGRLLYAKEKGVLDMSSSGRMFGGLNLNFCYFAISLSLWWSSLCLEGIYIYLYSWNLCIDSVSFCLWRMYCFGYFFY